MLCGLEMVYRGYLSTYQLYQVVSHSGHAASRLHRAQVTTVGVINGMVSDENATALTGETML